MERRCVCSGSRGHSLRSQAASGICFCCGQRRKFVCFTALLTSGFFPAEEKRALSFYLQLVYYSVKNMCKYFVQSPL